MPELSPHSVFITGSNSGLGLEFVKQFLELQHPPKYLFASCRNPEKAMELQMLARSHTSLCLMKVDVQIDEDIAAAAAKVESVVGDSGLNLLLNNAGLNNMEDGICPLTRNSLSRHFDVNVCGPMMVTKAFLPLLRQAALKGDPDSFSCNRAAVINVSSRMGLIGLVNKMNDYRYPYNCSKCALNMATSILANEIASDGILAVSLHPGSVKTKMGHPTAMLETPNAISQCMETLAALGQHSAGRLITYTGEYKSWDSTE